MMVKTTANEWKMMESAIGTSAHSKRLTRSVAFRGRHVAVAATLPAACRLTGRVAARSCPSATPPPPPPPWAAAVLPPTTLCSDSTDSELASAVVAFAALAEAQLTREAALSPRVTQTNGYLWQPRCNGRPPSAQPRGIATRWRGSASKRGASRRQRLAVRCTVQRHRTSR